jgi:hypothetical protein
MADFTDTEENWLKDQGINTTYRKLFWSKMRKSMNDRREFDGPLPDGVADGRRKVDFYKMAEQIEKIDKTTEETNGSFGSFWSGIGQMMAERKARKEHKSKK